jgi:general secretion pathway protein G
MRRTHPSAVERSGAGGFTLIELMLVLAVVGVLVALAFVGWKGWRDKVLTQTAQADIVALSLSIDDYLADTGALPASLAVIGRDGLQDPWGRAYVYRVLDTPKARGQARKDHSLVPLNTDYDLYSVGPDGASASPLTAQSSRDDILRANDGRFIGPASLY